MRPIAYHRTPRYIARFMASLLPRDRHIKILDPGCGRGEFLSILKEFGYENVTGIEIYKPFADYCAEKFPEYRVIHGDFLDHSDEYDAIISNPPYIKLKELPSKLRDKAVKMIGYMQGNLYYAFIIKAVELLRDGGVLVMIIPSSFRGNTYSSHVRKLLLDRGSVVKAFIFRSEGLFSDASPNVMIFKFIKGARLPIVSVSMVEDMDHALSFTSTIKMHQEAFLGIDVSKFAVERTVSDLSYGIYVGLASGCEECFRIPRELVDEMSDDEVYYVREFVTSSDCGVYELKGTTLYLFLDNVTREEDLARMPVIYRWLMRHEVRLKRRYLPRGVMWWHWLAVRNVDTFDKFSSAYKIFFPNIVRGRPRFCMTDKHIYPSGSVSAIIPKPGSEFLLLAYLNSSTFLELYRRFGFIKGERLVLKGSIIGRMPIPELSNHDVRRVSSIARRLINGYDESLATEVDEIFSSAMDIGQLKLDAYISRPHQVTLDEFVGRG